VVFYNNAVGSMGYRFSPADRQPCPVCGHPTGDCVGESESPTHISGFKTNDDPKQVTTFQVKEDILEEVEIVQGVKTKIIVHRKGKMISIEEAEKLGLL
jgi:hypothetical protein